MSVKAAEQKQERIEKAVAYLKDRLKGTEAAEAEFFLRAYCDRMAPDDVVAYTVENLYGAALALWKFAANRPPGKPKLRVYNPDPEEHGWKSSHTVVEIINDDMPFLVDSVTAALADLALTVHLTVHPLMVVVRDARGVRTSLAGGEKTVAAGHPGAASESFMHVEINEQSDVQVLSGIGETVEKVLADVRAAVEDWRPMLIKLEETIADLEKRPPPLDREEVEETRALLQWMFDNHFTFLGYREYDYEATKGEDKLYIVPGTGLGVLRDENVRVMGGRHGHVTMTPDVREFLRRPEALIVTKANIRSTVHRPVYLDYVGIKTFGKGGKAIGERRFVGLFTSAAYNRNPREIPFLRRKVEQVVARSGFSLTSHDGKSLLNILEQYPRDELFQIQADELYEIAAGILHLQERPRIRLFVRRDKFDRFISCFVFVPRERYNTDLRQRMQEILRAAYDGRISAFYTQLGDAPLARLHFIVGTTPGKVPWPDLDDLEGNLVRAARSWSDDLNDVLIERWGEEEGLRLRDRYSEAFPTAYREAFSAQNALHDIEKIEQLKAGSDGVALNLYRPLETPEHVIRFKIFHPATPVPLSDCLPMIEHMGLKVMEENPYRIDRASSHFWIHDFRLMDPAGRALDLSRVKAIFEEAFARVWYGDMEDDGFNRLVLRAGLGWREVVVLRAFCKYLRQTGIAFSQDYMENTLADNPEIARMLVELFVVRFNPQGENQRDRRAGKIQEQIKAALEEVASLDEDRILRRFLNLIQATLRTNYFQPAADGKAKPYLSFKLDSGLLEGLPEPRPFREISVYSPRMEAVHLRGGSVARGGIRWSDRREDFRTEVLGLMKAQMVKNAVIVPVGAKGGFVCKCLPTDGDRDAVLAEVVSCYRTMMQGMLDISDNFAGSDVVPPKDVLRMDGDDPYLVVAADKGTATFSDIANGIAGEYGFWLGDAFASGGSVGYDHKKMGITARGAWESVKRHFREVGRDIQGEDFTVAGVGDMSGDVFGNGMLLSRHIKLVAAFDHRHIFIDPDPDPAKSLTERERLFALPRSSWEDYDPALISKGGGVFKRGAKSVVLSPEIKSLLAIRRDKMTPADLMREILMARVDLLWFGGIGTYVKESHESNAEVGDRANDAIRVDAKDLHCLAVGEGANLGLTQRARVEYAQHGGRINTDAVDNSAGVDCSDHEVNIKILLGAVVTDGEMTGKQRDRLLAQMTDDVAELVLADNYLQTQALTIAQAQGGGNLDSLVRFMRSLERSGRLNRALEFLPDDEKLADRRTRNQGLTRPELAVLMAYAKTTIYADLLETDLPDDPYLVTDMHNYFPRLLRKKFAAIIDGHRLRREIITTLVANSLVNRAGITFVHDMIEETDGDVSAVARAYVVTRDAFRLRPLWLAIQSLDNKVPAALQTDMLKSTVELARLGSLWFLRNGTGLADIAAAIDTYAAGIAELAGSLDGVLPDLEAQAFSARLAQLGEQGVPDDLARQVAGFGAMEAALDIVHAARDSQRPVAEVAAVYFGVGACLGLNWLRSAASEVVAENHWERQALTSTADDLFSQQRHLTNAVLREAAGMAAAAAIDKWVAARSAAVTRVNQLIDDIRASGGADVAKLTIASAHVRSMIQPRQE